MAICLPSCPDYVPQVKKEARWLSFLAIHLSMPITNPIAIGKPSKDYLFIRSINSYINGWNSK